MIYLSGIFINAYSQSAADSILSKLPSITNDTSKLIAYRNLLFELTFDDPPLAIEYGLKAVELAHELSKSIDEVESLTSIGYVYEIQRNGSEAFRYYHKGYELAQEIDYVKGQLDGLIGSGTSQWFLGNSGKAISFYQQAIDLAKANNEQPLLADANNNLGNVYLDLDQFDKALEHYIACDELLTDDNRVKSIVTVNIGLVHFEMNNLERAKEYFQKGIALAEGIDDLHIKAFNLQKLGLIAKSQNRFDEALEYYEACKYLYEKLSNRRDLLQVSTNIGYVYLETNQYQKAIEQFRESVNNTQESDNKTNYCHALAGLSQAFINLSMFGKAKDHAGQLIVTAREIESPLQVAEGIRLMSQIHYQLEDYKTAFEFHQDLATLQDSIFSTQQNELVLSMDAKYESEKKEQEIALLNAEKRIAELNLQKQETWKNYLLIISGSIFIVALISFSQYKAKARAHKELKVMDKTKTRFFTNISHEFRTPLTLIIGPARERMNSVDTQKDKALFGMILRNAERLLELINQLLDLAKLDAHQMKLDLVPGDLSRFLSQLTESFDSLAIEKGIIYERAISSEGSIIPHDPDKIQKIVTNLLSNAFKFTPAGGKVEIRGTLKHNSYEIKVTDSGSGLDAEDLKELFTRFYQASDNAKGGTGVGLALTKELVELHKGEINVSSEKNAGTTFTVLLPVQKESVTSINKPIPKIIIPESIDSTEDSPLSESETDSSTILLVEDNPDVRNYLQSILEHHFDLQFAENGKIGLDLAIKTIPDLIVSDLMMPELDGIELCKKLKTDERTSHIPVVLLTAKATTVSKLEGLHTGADDYLTKPFNESELMARLNNLIDQRKALRKRFSNSLTLEPSMISITPPDETFLIKVKSIVENNLSNYEFSVEDLQQEIGMSRMQLHRKLRALTNSSASEFIRTMRLLRAAQLLKTNGVNVSEAAYRSGFNNLSYFAKCFKEKFNVPPSQYSNNT